MTLSRWQTVWTVALSLLGLCCPVGAVIIEVREYHGKKISCIHSGIMAFSQYCDGAGYARVFTGTVLSVTDISDFDKLLRLLPEESLVGTASGEVSAIVDQACMPANLPEIIAGDKWLLYLQPGKSSDVFTISFDSPSKPIALAQSQIELLRHVARLTDVGLITGQVTRIETKGNRWDAVPVAGRSIIATRKSDGATSEAVSDEGGHFQLELAPGSYHVTANVYPRSPISEGDVWVERGGCLAIGFQLDANKARTGTARNFWGLIPPP